MRLHLISTGYDWYNMITKSGMINKEKISGSESFTKWLAHLTPPHISHTTQTSYTYTPLSCTRLMPTSFYHLCPCLAPLAPPHTHHTHVLHPCLAPIYTSCAHVLHPLFPCTHVLHHCLAPITPLMLMSCILAPLVLMYCKLFLHTFTSIIPVIPFETLLYLFTSFETLLHRCYSSKGQITNDGFR